MSTAFVDSLATLPGSSVDTGTVDRIQDGFLFVAADGVDRTRPASILSKTTSLSFSQGDTVLVWRNENSESCVVLGRIERKLDAKKSPLPDELVIEANKQLTLKCGDGSITIRNDGKVLIKGKDLVSRAQQSNRIKGGSVSIN